MMNYNGLVSVKCPYCGTVNKLRARLVTNNKIQAIYCDCEQGGCDKQFAFKAQLVPQVEVFKLELVEN